MNHPSNIEQLRRTRDRARNHLRGLESIRHAIGGVEPTDEEIEARKRLAKLDEAIATLEVGAK